MIQPPEVLDYFVDLTDKLLNRFDVVEFLNSLTVMAAAASGADAVGLVLTDHHGDVRFMASNNEEGKLLELFQIQNDEGPCRDALLTGMPVVNADLGQAAHRWPTFAPAARSAGFQSVHAFPMRARERSIGALNIFGIDNVSFDPGDVRVVQGMTDLATIAVLQHRDRYQAEVIAERLHAALESRITVEQAVGGLARSQSISSAEAFDVLLITARTTHVALVDVARSVIAELDTPRPLRA